MAKLRGQVKVGCEFFMECEGDLDFISIETGVPGLYIDLNIEEGLEFIPKREGLLQERLNRTSFYINDVQQHIHTIQSSIGTIGEMNIEESVDN